jgi:putative radical SAM enzyme (TIGR03279 family)
MRGGRAVHGPPFAVKGVMVRIAEVLPDSIAEELHLRIGSRIVRINGAPVRDTIDLRFMEAEERVELEVQEGTGTAIIYEIEKDAGEGLGVIPAPDAVRECANKCVFCFIDGNPPDVRASLFLRDDDFRLSFTYGSYVTLTNLGTKGFQRLIDQKLSPLYVSVHATDPAVRMRLLGVPRGGDIVERLHRLRDAGIEVHTQVVLCPGWNDGEELDRTVEDLWRLGPGILSLSVVPVGLTHYNLERPVRLLAAAEARAAIRQVEAARVRALDARGTGWAYAADEMFLLAGEPVPSADYYDDWPLTENGVGAVRSFLDDAAELIAAPPRLPGRRIGVVTGARMGEVLASVLPALAKATGASFELLTVENRLFGPTVTTAGLLAGADILDAIREAEARAPLDAVLLPAESLNDDLLFIDSLPYDAVDTAVRATVIPGHTLTAALAGL